jgi:serine protease Do
MFCFMIHMRKSAVKDHNKEWPVSPTFITTANNRNAGIPPRILRAMAGLIGVLAILTFATGNAWARPAPENFADLAEKLLPSVVNISTVQAVSEKDKRRNVPNLPPGSPFQDFFDEFFDRQERGGDRPVRPTMSLGSGFIISEDGYIVTNNHVVGEAEKITVSLTDGEEFVAELIGRDAMLDVALLKIDAGKKLPALEFGDSDAVRVGEWVMAIGNPFGLGGSVTAGIVSALHRDINAGNYDYFIQTDASINRGNSGGPMFNLDGEVIGINTMIFSPNGGNIGIGFAIPSSQAERSIAQLKEFGRTKRGWIGVSIRMVTDDIAASLGLDSDEGAFIENVVPDGPAEKAGIQVADIILTFDGEPIEEMRELPRVVAGTAVGKTVKVRLLRNGQALVVKLTTAELKEEPTLVASADPDTQHGSSTDEVMGMRLGELTAATRERYEIPADLSGVIVANLSRSSEAAQKGFRPGDVIVQVDQSDVEVPAQVIAGIDKVRDSERGAVLFRVYRGGGYFHFAVPLEDSEG